MEKETPTFTQRHPLVYLVILVFALIYVAILAHSSAMLPKKYRMDTFWD